MAMLERADCKTLWNTFDMILIAWRKSSTLGIRMKRRTLGLMKSSGSKKPRMFVLDYF